MIVSTRDVRALKGCAASILLIGLLDPQPHKAGWYQIMTGYKDNAVSEGLALLVEYGIFLKTKRGWSIAKETQLALELSTGYPQVQAPNRDYHDSRALVVSSYIKDSNNIIDLTTTTSTSTRDASNRDNHDSLKATCIELGIEDPKASQIAAMDITPEYIQAHVANVVAEGKGIALAIWRIEHKRKAKIKDLETRVCYECGKEFMAENKHVLLCDDCFELEDGV